MMRDLRAAAILLVLALLSFAGASGYVYFSVRANIINTIGASLNDEAARNLATVQARIAGLMGDVDTWARSPFLLRTLVRRDPGDMRDVSRGIAVLVGGRQELEAVAVFAADGEIVAALRPERVGLRIFKTVQEVVAAGRRYQSDITDHTGAGVRGLAFALPIFDENSKRVIGGVAAVIGWEAVSASLAALRVETRPQDLTHRLVLSDADQDILYHSGLVGGQETEANAWDILHGAHLDSLAVSARSTSVGLFEDPHWTLHQFVDEALAFEPADRMGRRLILASGLVLVVAGLGAAFTIQRVLSRRAASAARRLKDLAEAAVEGIVICEAGGRIVEANASFCDLVGLPRDELTGLGLIGFIRAEDRALVRRLLERPAQATAMVAVETAQCAARPVELIRRAATAGDGQTILALRDMTEKLATQSRIEFLAHHDTLTGLSNRLHFNVRFAEELETAARNGRSLAVLCVDLDRFKAVNDTHGHHGGDALLRATADRIARFLKGGGAAARLGGDEFVAILPCDAATDVEAAARALSEELARPVTFEGRLIATSASIGLAAFPADGDEPEALMRAADLALYRSKQGGRGGVCRYDGELAETTRRRQRLQLDLIRAIAEETLSLVYQPQAVCQTGAVSGFEALLRWQHPEFGAIPPTTFVGIAEETNLVVALGDWVLRTACAEAARWPRPLEVAVNISPVQIMSDNLPERVAAILKATGLDPRRLELEITENVLIRDIDRAQAELERLKALGVRIAMDDFGTGYSSLAYLQRIAFDRLKIDRAFIANLEDSRQARTIVRAAVSLARGLGLPVLAEGVETEGQLALLRSERCDGVQGYLIGRPLPIEAWRDTIAGTAAATAAARRA
jgi:diguanylate cyclase (GGDEF)-like protein/PAS domain S-box-containing protein